MLGDEIRQEPAGFRPRIQRRHVHELLAAGREELRPVLHLDFFHRLETVDREAGTHHRDFIDAARGQARHEIDGIRTQPRARAEFGMEAHRPLIVAEHQLVSEQARGLATFVEIRVAVVEQRFRNTVERDHEVTRAPLRFPLLGHARAQCVDVTGMIVILRDEAQLRQPAPAAQLFVDLVVNRAGSGSAILRKVRHDEDALCTRGAKFLQRLAHRGFRVQHAGLDGQRREDTLRKRGGKIRPQPVRIHVERRALGGPDLPVLHGHASRAKRQDEPVQDRQPQQPWQLDHPRIRQQPLQECAHITRLGRRRRARVHEQDTEALGSVVSIFG